MLQMNSVDNPTDESNMNVLLSFVLVRCDSPSGKSLQAEVSIPHESPPSTPLLM
jgi:hypothetical protein